MAFGVGLRPVGIFAGLLGAVRFGFVYVGRNVGFSLDCHAKLAGPLLGGGGCDCQTKLPAARTVGFPSGFPPPSFGCGTRGTSTARHSRHTASVHPGRPRFHARPGCDGPRGLAACRHRLARSPGTATRRGSAPRFATPCAACRSSRVLRRWAAALGSTRSGDAAGGRSGFALARAHDLKATIPIVPVEFVVPLTIRTYGTANNASGRE